MPQPKIHKLPKLAKPTQPLCKVGVVVIGRNEGNRLKRCLTSLRQQTDDEIIYVDSGSSDDSVNMARSLGCHIVELDPAIAFSMARARNNGFAELRKVVPLVTYVQFVDGDCELEPGWMSEAIAFLEQSDLITVACGFRRERYPNASIYNHLTDMEWQGAIGEIDACGGDALYRVDAFATAGGFNEVMIAGEEPELCARLRQAGGKIWRLDLPMTIHDAALTRFAQWWTRARRGGYAYAHGFALHRGNFQKHKRRQLISSMFYGLFVPFMWGSGIILSLAYANPTVAMTCTFLSLLILLKPFTGAFRHRLSLGNTIADAGLYAIFCTMGKIPEALGILGYAFDNLMGKKSGLIEYKSPTG